MYYAGVAIGFYILYFRENKLRVQGLCVVFKMFHQFTAGQGREPGVVLDDIRYGVTGLRIKSGETGKTRDLEVDGIFVFVGILPNTGFVDCEKDDAGFIITNQGMETSAPGIFAAGDCRVTPLRQVSTAVG